MYYYTYMKYLYNLDVDTFNKLVGLCYSEPDQYGRRERWTCPNCNKLVPGNMRSWGWKKCLYCKKMPDWKTIIREMKT